MRRELSNQIGQVCFAQFLLFRQARSTEGHAQGEGLTLMGNLPFFVSADSIDVMGKTGAFSSGRAASATFCLRCTAMSSSVL
jgi:4-alpha-glucanotransferase